MVRWCDSPSWLLALPPPWAVKKFRAHVLLVHFAVVVSRLWWLNLVFRKVSLRVVCIAAVNSACGPNALLAQGSGSLRPGLARLSEVRLSPRRFVCRCRYRVLLDWHRLWRGHSQAVLHRWWQWHPACQSLAPLSLGWHCRVLLLRSSRRVPRVQRCAATVAGGPGVGGCLICLFV